MNRFTKIHDTHWAATHKFSEGFVFHRWFANELEKEMLKINPNVTLPYWDTTSDFSAPEKSIIWNWFGRSGNANGNFCVSDGPFANTQLNYPNRHCLRREWNRDGTISPLEAPEWLSVVNQIGVLPDFFKISKEMLTPFLDQEKPHKDDPKNSVSYFKGRDFYIPLPWGQFSLLTSITLHFKTHLAVGMAQINFENLILEKDIPLKYQRKKFLI